ncbi:hypothetical protein LRP49_22505 [Enterovibrio sp. ZSDZ35]|uniref:Glycoside hydrolase 123 C-terminal domain-containing protein n=1 Tax=Enterovibrio qingdaonensis TaxID=2899818 RepID=A0ABT5QSI9_9GAMM|nr:hypothetical protein [Enterovibrio sp. ZSDZ35]MDD1783955.1 hypothetical protein [Enterovibrio sp. ZSDZ35]
MRLLLTIFLLTISMQLHAEVRLNKSDFVDVQETTLLEVKGNNFSNKNVILVIRADDSINPGYADRANIERVIPPGEFELQVPFASLRTPHGKQLSLNKLEQMIIFPGSNESRFMISSSQVYTPKPLAKGVYAWDLGPQGSAIWPGFKPLTIESGLLSGKALRPIDRSARMQVADPLTIDGIRGIDYASLPLPEGEWQITLWLRDSGEWEFLPHPLKREILANGKRVHLQNLTPSQWISRVYLQGKEHTVTPKSTSWSHFGKREDHRITFSVTSDGTPVELALSGDNVDAQFVSGILAVPTSNPLVLDMLTRQRQTWWEKNWPVSAWTAWPTGQTKLKAAHAEGKAAAGTSAFMTFMFEQGNAKGSPLVMLEQPSNNSIRLPASYHWSQWQLTRSHLASSLLKADDKRLRHGIMPENNGVAMPRRVIVRIDVPEGTPAGHYQGQLTIMLSGRKLNAPFSLDVLDAKLPPLHKPVGVYLEKPVHFGWFPELAALADEAMLCDLTFMRKLGLTGVSPPYPTPSNEDQLSDFESMSHTLHQLGYIESMAYAPAKRLSQAIGTSSAASVVADIESNHKQRLQHGPYWSIADEPSNPGNVDLFKEMHRHFSLTAPDAKLAGHLNHKEDREYLDMFDLVLVNDGFGIDKNEVTDTQRNDRKVWLYNLPFPRAASGFYLWQSDADGFLKWHGRMPTADPYDPTDGREFDVQFFYPTELPCPNEPDIHTDLYEIAQGIVDYRWVLWLEAQAEQRPDARQLLKELRQTVPESWDAMLAVPPSTLDVWRNRIINLSQ